MSCRRSRRMSRLRSLAAISRSTGRAARPTARWQLGSPMRGPIWSPSGDPLSSSRTRARSCTLARSARTGRSPAMTWSNPRPSAASSCRRGRLGTPCYALGVIPPTPARPGRAVAARPLLVAVVAVLTLAGCIGGEQGAADSPSASASTAIASPSIDAASPTLQPSPSSAASDEPTFSPDATESPTSTAAPSSGASQPAAEGGQGLLRQR
jgi:hypothetical protein